MKRSVSQEGQGTGGVELMYSTALVGVGGRRQDFNQVWRAPAEALVSGSAPQA